MEFITERMGHWAWRAEVRFTERGWGVWCGAGASWGYEEAEEEEWFREEQEEKGRASDALKTPDGVVIPDHEGPHQESPFSWDSMSDPLSLSSSKL